MITCLTDRGLVRPTNQDAAFARRVADGSAVLAVADGVGGYPGGERASAIAIDAVARMCAEALASDPPGPLLEAAFGDAGERVSAEQRGAHGRMSTTLVAALVRDGRAWVANVGDSRAYLLADGDLTQVTTDHSWVEEEIRAGRLRPNDPRVAAQRHVITRAIGGDASIVDRFGPLELAQGDALLLCSDGLHGYVPDAAIAAALAPPDAGAAERLIALALAAGGVDNVAVALFARG